MTLIEIYDKYKDSNLGFCIYKEGEAEEIVKELWEAIKQLMKEDSS